MLDHLLASWVIEGQEVLLCVYIFQDVDVKVPFVTQGVHLGSRAGHRYIYTRPAQQAEVDL